MVILCSLAFKEHTLKLGMHSEKWNVWATVMTFSFSHVEVGAAASWFSHLACKVKEDWDAQRLFPPSPDWHLIPWLHKYLPQLSVLYPALNFHLSPICWATRAPRQDHSDDMCGAIIIAPSSCGWLHPTPLCSQADLVKEICLQKMCWNTINVSETTHLEIFL